MTEEHTSTLKSSTRDFWMKYKKAVFITVGALTLLGVIIFLVLEIHGLRTSLQSSNSKNENTTQASNEDSEDPIKVSGSSTAPIQVPSTDIPSIIPAVGGTMQKDRDLSADEEGVQISIEGVEYYKVKTYRLVKDGTLTFSLDPQTETMFVGAKDGDSYGVSIFIDGTWTKPVFGTQEEFVCGDKAIDLYGATRLKVHSAENHSINIRRFYQKLK